MVVVMSILYANIALVRSVHRQCKAGGGEGATLSIVQVYAHALVVDSADPMSMLAPMIVKTVPPASCTCLACSVVLLPPNSARCGFIQSHRYFGDTDCDRSVLPREGIRLDSSPCATHVRTPTPRIPRRPEPRTCSVTATLPNYRFCFRVRLSHTFGFLAGRWRNKRVVGRFLLQRMGIHRAPGCILSTRGSLQQRSTLHVCALWGGGGWSMSSVLRVRNAAG